MANKDGTLPGSGRMGSSILDLLKGKKDMKSEKPDEASAASGRMTSSALDFMQNKGSRNDVSSNNSSTNKSKSSNFNSKGDQQRKKFKPTDDTSPRPRNPRPRLSAPNQRGRFPGPNSNTRFPTSNSSNRFPAPHPHRKRFPAPKQGLFPNKVFGNNQTNSLPGLLDMPDQEFPTSGNRVLLNNPVEEFTSKVNRVLLNTPTDGANNSSFEHYYPEEEENFTTHTEPFNSPNKFSGRSSTSSWDEANERKIKKSDSSPYTNQLAKSTQPSNQTTKSKPFGMGSSISEILGQNSSSDNRDEEMERLKQENEELRRDLNVLSKWEDIYMDSKSKLELSREESEKLKKEATDLREEVVGWNKFEFYVKQQSSNLNMQLNVLENVLADAWGGGAPPKEAQRKSWEQLRLMSDMLAKGTEAVPPPILPYQP